MLSIREVKLVQDTTQQQQQQQQQQRRRCVASLQPHSKVDSSSS
jgi:hypothetical protein